MDGGRFQIPEVIFAVLGENFRNGQPRLLGSQAIRVDPAPARSLRKFSRDGALTPAHRPDEDDIDRRCGHKTRRSDRGAAAKKAERSGVDPDDVPGFCSLFVRVKFILDLISFLQRLKTIGLDGREVHEYIGLDCRVQDKAETLFLVEPLHGTP